MKIRCRFSFLRNLQPLTGMVVISMCLLSGCVLPSNKPLKTLTYPAALVKPDGNSHLIVLLRGRRGSYQNFDKYGWVELLQKRFPHADIVAPDTHLGYYMARSVTDRLHEDIVTPAVEKEYGKIWFVGVSMGSLGALLYESEYPDQVDQFLLVAPFVGYDKVRDAMDAAGGLSEWRNQLGDVSDDSSWQVKFWAWVADHHPQFTPKVRMGYGLADRYVDGQAFFAELLPEEQRIITNGKHHYDDFTEIIELLTDDLVD